MTAQLDARAPVDPGRGEAVLLTAEVSRRILRLSGWLRSEHPVATYATTSSEGEARVPDLRARESRDVNPILGMSPHRSAPAPVRVHRGAMSTRHATEDPHAGPGDVRRPAEEPA